MEEYKFNNKMYFPKDYISELKKSLLDLNIVEEIKRPEKFADVEEKEFVNFIERELEVPCKFIWIDNNKFNDWTIKLLRKINENVQNKEIIWKLIDVLIFDNCFANNDEIGKEIFEDIGIEEFDINNIPVLSHNNQYYTCEECFLYNVPKEALRNGEKFKEKIIAE